MDTNLIIYYIVLTIIIYILLGFSILLFDVFLSNNKEYILRRHNYLKRYSKDLLTCWLPFVLDFYVKIVYEKSSCFRCHKSELCDKYELGCILYLDEELLEKINFYNNLDESRTI